MNTFSIINIGSELMRGQTLNTHHQQIATRLKAYGWVNSHTTITGDFLDTFSPALISAIQQTDFIIVTGGLGPTHDDRTLEFISTTLGLPLKINNQAKGMLEKIFRKKKSPLNAFQMKQAYLPLGSTPLFNRFGTAPGVYLKWAHPTGFSTKKIFVLPGPPREMIPLLEKEVIPLLLSEKASRQIYLTHELMIPLVYESDVAQRIQRELKQFADLEIGIYAQPGIVQLVFSQLQRNQLADQTSFSKKIEKFRMRLKMFPILENGSSIYQQVQNMLLKTRSNVSVAESCTGGLLAASFTDQAGSSQIFQGGSITYANEEKIRQLQISRSTLRLHGAVSHEISKQMATNIQKQTGSTFGIAVSGIAGPTGGTPKKPIGTVFISVATKQSVSSHHFFFTGDRSSIRIKSVIASYVMLLESIRHKRYTVPCRLNTRSNARSTVTQKKL